jgi:hypothetical protein
MPEKLNAESGAGLAAASGYAPWQPPFRYNMDGQWIEDSKGQRMLDIRGWGYLTGKGSEALGMDEDAAAKIQDAIGKRTADLLNADVKAHNTGYTDGR